jgi:AcrR family transcriptional regulator
LSSKPLRADARRNRARILDAASAVFAEHGAEASTEQVAARAGVAIGTVFRHFPTKQDLLAAILKDLLADLTSAGDTDLFAFFTRVVTVAAEKKVVVDALAREGVAVGVEGPVAVLADTLDGLLAAAREAGAVRADVRLDEVLALLTATAQGALRAGWSADLRGRVLARVFAGLVP